MSNKVYVGNISYDVQESQIQALFDEVGTVVSVKIIKDKFTDQSKGFGFVEMVTEQDAEKAAQSLDGKELLGRPLRVNIAKDKPRSSYSDSSHRRGFARVNGWHG